MSTTPWKCEYSNNSEGYTIFTVTDCEGFELFRWEDGCMEPEDAILYRDLGAFTDFIKHIVAVLNAGSKK